MTWHQRYHSRNGPQSAQQQQTNNNPNSNDNDDNAQQQQHESLWADVDHAILFALALDMCNSPRRGTLKHALGTDHHHWRCRVPQVEIPSVNSFVSAKRTTITDAQHAPDTVAQRGTNWAQSCVLVHKIGFPCDRPETKGIHCQARLASRTCLRRRLFVAKQCLQFLDLVSWEMRDH